MNAVAVQVAAFEDAQRRCAAAIRALTGTAGAPGVPGPPPEPRPDDGAGAFDSEPWWSRVDEVIKKQLADAGAGFAEIIGYTDTARHLRHYLDASGEDLVVDPAAIMRDVPGLERRVDGSVSQIERAAHDAVSTGHYDEPVNFTTGWAPYYIYKPENPNWYLAMGAMRWATTGVVTVRRPSNPGEAPQVSVDYEVHVWDRYNWDGGKSTQIGPFTVTDETLAEMHRAGGAREFDVVGSTETLHYEGNVPAPGAGPLLPPPDDRAGTRGDPGRDRHTEPGHR